MKDPRRHHNHRHRQQGVPFEACPRCAYDRAICEKKLRFTTWAEADEWVFDYHVEHDWRPPLMTRYVCRWCDGWHMKTARDKHERVRAAQLRRKWAGPGSDRDEQAFQHWVRTGEVPRRRRLTLVWPAQASDEVLAAAIEAFPAEREASGRIVDGQWTEITVWTGPGEAGHQEVCAAAVWAEQVIGQPFTVLSSRNALRPRD